MSGLQSYLRLFDDQRSLLESHSCAALNGHRDEARSFLAGVDFPHRKTERYRNTDAAALFAGNYATDFTRTLDAPVTTAVALFRTCPLCPST